MNRRSIGGRRFAGLVTLVLVGGSLAAVAAAPAGADTTTAIVTPCPSGPPVLQLANPNPGDVLSQGDYIISGLAFDPAATQGSGVSRVDLFLGQRDSGGLFLASVTPGQSMEATSSNRSFEVKATVPTSVSGGRDLVAYAYSSVTGQTTVESIPVFVGAAPTPTPIPSSGSSVTPVALTSTTSSTCQTSTASAAPQPAVGVSSLPVLQLANPGAGDVLSNGDVIVEGIAYDPSATQSAGVDRVELFLDSRDSGGTPLGSGVPGQDTGGNMHAFKIKASIPSSANGAHDFVAYAHSSVTDQESVQSVPVFIGAAPTPTPRPKSS